MARLQSGTRSVRLESIATPTADTDAANKAYVDDHSLDLETNGTLVTRRAVANFDPVFTVQDDSTNSRTNIDIADSGIRTNHIQDANITTAKIADANVTTGKLAADAVTNAKLADNAVQLENMADDSVGSNELVDDSVGTAALNVTGPNSNQGNANQLLQSDGDGSMSWVNPELDTLSDVTISSPAQEHLLYYGPGNQWVNSQVLQVDDVSGVPTLTHVFGRRLVTAIPFQSFEFATNSSVSPRGLLHWDEPLTSVTFTNTNNPAFDDEYADRLSAVTVGTDTQTAFPSNIDSDKQAVFTRTITPANVDSDTDLARDQRSTAYNGAAGGARTATATITTNLGNSTTRAQGWSWGPAGIVSASGSAGQLRFDAVDSDWQLRIVLHDTADGVSNVSNVGISQTGLASDLGTPPSLAAGTASTIYNVTVSNSVSIYHDTTISGNAVASFTRPTSVSIVTEAANRAFTDTQAFNLGTPTTLYPTWTVVAANGTAFDTATPANTLGALGNDGYAGTGVTGHTISVARAGDTSTATWRGTNYGFNNSAGTAPVRFMIVAPSTTTEFTQPLSLNAPAVPNNTRTVSLGHTGHTVTYTVYEFTIGAGANFEVNPA